jgi:hypothetical protein
MSTQQHRQNLISRTRQAATKLFDAYDELKSCETEWNLNVKNQIIDAVGLPLNADGTPNPTYVANDFKGNEGINKQDINQVLSAALTALTTFINTTDGKKIEDVQL